MGGYKKLQQSRRPRILGIHTPEDISNINTFVHVTERGEIVEHRRVHEQMMSPRRTDAAKVLLNMSGRKSRAPVNGYQTFMTSAPSGPSTSRGLSSPRRPSTPRFPSTPKGTSSTCEYTTTMPITLVQTSTESIRDTHQSSVIKSNPNVKMTSDHIQTEHDYNGILPTEHSNDISGDLDQSGEDIQIIELEARIQGVQEQVDLVGELVDILNGCENDDDDDDDDEVGAVGVLCADATSTPKPTTSQGSTPRAITPIASTSRNGTLTATTPQASSSNDSASTSSPPKRTKLHSNSGERRARKAKKEDPPPLKLALAQLREYFYENGATFARDDDNSIILGDNGTRLNLEELENVNIAKCSGITRAVASSVYTREELATHSMTGTACPGTVTIC